MPDAGREATCCCGRVRTSGWDERSDVMVATCPDCPVHGWTDERHVKSPPARETTLAIEVAAGLHDQPHP